MYCPGKVNMPKEVFENMKKKMKKQTQEIVSKEDLLKYGQKYLSEIDNES
jgi:hypothetical protein